MNIMLEISFDGSDYHGWQIQPDESTVCGEIEKALMRLYDGEYIRLIGSSRTDAGVHAISYTANFHPPERDGEPIKQFEMSELQRALQALTPESILIDRAEIMPEDFHARFSAKGKIYQYRVSDFDILFERRYVHRFYGDLNLASLNEFAAIFLGEHDFSAFAISRSIPPNPICHIRSSRWYIRPDGVYVYEIEGDRFLHEMVRMIVGAQLDMIRGILTATDIERFFRCGERMSPENASRQNSAQIKTAPPNALLLVRAIY